MGKAQRYIFREVSFLFGIVLIIFTFLLTLEQLVELTELVLEGVPVGTLMRLLVYLSPSFLIFAIPLAFLASTAMAFSQFSFDGEIIALKATGASLMRLLLPVVIIAILLYFLMSFLTLSAQPKGSQWVRRTLLGVVQSHVNLNLQPQVFIRTFDGLVLYIDEIDKNSLRMRGIMIADLREPGTKQTIFAREGWLESEPDSPRLTLHLSDGSVHRTKSSGNTYQVLTFSENRLSLDVGSTLRRSTARLARERFKSLGKIREQLKILPADAPQRFALLLQLHKMFSLPISCFLVGIIGAPLGISNRRSGKSGGFVLSVGVALLYYVVALGGEALAKEGRLAPWVAGWAPNFFLGALAVYLMVKASRESPILLLEIIDRLAEFLRGLRKNLSWGVSKGAG